MCIRGTFDQRSIKDEIINEVNMWNIREVPPGGGQASQYFLNPLQIDNILNEVNIILETLRPTAESYTFISFLFEGERYASNIKTTLVLLDSYESKRDEVSTTIFIDLNDEETIFPSNCSSRVKKIVKIIEEYCGDSSSPQNRRIAIDTRGSGSVIYLRYTQEKE